MNEALDSADRRRACSHFAHRARHELLTPLSGLSMLCSLLPGRDRQLDQLAAQAESATRRMTELLRACVDYVDAELPPRAVDDVDLARSLRDAVACVRSAEPGFARADVVVAESLPSVRGHGASMQRVWGALLDNAWRYGPREAARIDVGARIEGANWRLEVADRGPGLEPAQCARVLLPFERLHAWDAIPGFGLGLATARRLVRAHGGELGVEPRTGGGLVAWFTLPRERDDLRPRA